MTDRDEDEIRHEFYDVARRPVLPRLFVVVLVEFADEFFKDRAHAVIVKPRVQELFFLRVLIDRIGAEVDVRGGEFFDDGAQPAGVGEVVHLLFELEFFDDVLYIFGVSIEILQEVLLHA